MTALAGITFEQAKIELREISRRYEGRQIDRHAWCHGVHDVILRFQAGQQVAPVDAAPRLAAAAPRVPNAAQPVASELPIMVANRDPVERHLTTGHGV